MPHERTRQNAGNAPEGRIGAGVTNTTAPAEGPSPGTAQDRVPSQPFHGLDELWLQVAGTLCNLSCRHCFVTCGPTEERHAMMSRAEVAARVAEGVALGVREVYLTGGEPFLNPELEGIVEDTLAHAPVTVLTNGTLFTARRVAWLSDLTRASRYALEMRISLDGLDAPSHDSFRGPGAWLRTLSGLRALVAAGLAPIVTVTRPDDEDPLAFASRATAALHAEGIADPRLKLLPMFRLGREVERSGSNGPFTTLAGLPPEAFDAHRLQCGHGRAVTSRGVYVCPLLVDEPGGRMADTLADAARPYRLAHPACATCWATGMTCANA